MALRASEKISAAFPFKAHYMEVLGSRIHYVDEGQGDPVLFLHGNPTWSYLWRNIIPYVAPHARVIAPDLIGMGRSDKPDIEYRFPDHLRFVKGFIEHLGLRNVTLVLHDWGAALGFRYAMRHERNIKGLAVMEGMLMPVPGWEVLPTDFAQMLKAFRTPDVGWDLIVNKNVFIEQVLPSATIRKLSDEEMEHYRGPFKDPASRKPVWRWPNEIPIAGEPADVMVAVAAYNVWLCQTLVPKLLLHVTPGAVIQAPQVAWAREHLPNLKTADLGPGIHFVQEDHPHRIGEELVRWYRTL